MDDISLSADLDTLERIITRIIEAEATTGIKLHTSKYEIIMDDFSFIAARSIFKDFIKVQKEDTTLLGASILKGPSLDRALQKKIDILNKLSVV